MAGWGKGFLRIDQGPGILQAWLPQAIVLIRARKSDDRQRAGQGAYLAISQTVTG
jgi:hypothetical protein